MAWKLLRPITYAALQVLLVFVSKSCCGSCRSLRHQCCREGLEEERNHVQEAREVGADAAAECKQAGEERTGGEEESNERKGEHEACQVKVLARAGKVSVLIS